MKVRVLLNIQYKFESRINDVAYLTLTYVDFYGKTNRRWRLRVQAMGGSASTTKFDVVKDKELKDFLSDEDIRLVQETWLTIQGDFDAIGLTLFNR